MSGARHLDHETAMNPTRSVLCLQLPDHRLFFKWITVK